MLFMINGSIDIFPVFKKYNALRDEILTIYPRTLAGLPVSDSYSVRYPRQSRELELLTSQSGLFGNRLKAVILLFVILSFPYLILSLHFSTQPVPF